MRHFRTTILAATLALAFAWSAKADAAELTRDQQTACEVMLCLPVLATAPQECMDSLRKYFSIRASSPGKLLRKRRDFLNQCPTNSPGLADSLVSGDCNPAFDANCVVEDDPGKPPSDRQQ